MSELILIKGKLTVAARGFWFTSGGEKGAFGYYPHLKNCQRQPVYPDTQIQGDLRMAATWLKNTEYGAGQKTYYETLFQNIFGHGWIKKDQLSTESPIKSMCYPTDLALSDDSVEKWSNKRFVVKPRIAINDDLRTVEEHMLVDLEVAWLDGLHLESTLYLGYFETESEAKDAWVFIQDAVSLLSGFGAFRSRGFGRGKIEMTDWANIEKMCLSSEGSCPPEESSSLPYFLEALTNMRNKPTEPGKTQLIDSLYCITDMQLRSWFVNAYYQLNNKQWPSMDEISTIHFPTLYPCPNTSGYGYPAPMTMVRFNNGTYQDMWGKERDENPANNGAPASQTPDAKRPKPKAMWDNEFISQHPDVFNLRTEIRMRNALDMDFQSGKGGLFAQELIPAGTIYGGAITFESPDSAFAQKAKYIFLNARPLIKGTAFSPASSLSNISTTAASGPTLLIKPLSGSVMVDIVDRITEKGNHPAVKEDSIRLTTLREYNTTLKRPRRNRIAIAPGAVLNITIPEKTVFWTGFEKEFTACEEKDKTKQDPANDKQIAHNHAEIEQMISVLPNLKLTRAQAGFLREFLNPGMKQEAAKKILTQREEKHKEKKEILPATLYGNMASLADGKDIAALRYYVRLVLDKLAEQWWREKKDKLTKGGS